MQGGFVRKSGLWFGLLASAGLVAMQPWLASPAYGQTAVTGALTGVVIDTTGAVVPAANVTVTDTATGAVRKVTTNEAGRYTVSLLKPSKYEISATANGLESNKTTVVVLVGQTPNADITVNPAGSSQTVTVSAQTIPLTDTQTPSQITTFTEQQVQNLPAPGGDITTVAYTAPGVVVNAGGSYGNFSADGLPGTSNLYVLNGFDNQDPFLNLNNSGSSNLTLGQGEISEAAVVQNGYGTQYGRAAGVIINYTTKSGSNQLHGMANYYYNGDVLNANDWFRNNAGAPRQRAISNEWAANVGGPIIKDKLFFFADYEGLHYVLPASGQAIFPSQAFQNYALANVPADSLPLYKQAFALYNSSPSAAHAVPVTTGNGQLQDSTGNLGCGGLAGTPTGTGGIFGVDTSCENAAEGSASNINKEWLLTSRVDWHISDKQTIFGRYKMDRGTQPTYTNFVSPLFNTVSTQPSYEGQLNDTYAFNSHLTNQFIFAANWYTAYFGPANLQQTLNTFPTYLYFADGAINTGATFGSLGAPYYFPQGRNVTQYQFVDDLSWIKGNHTFRFGYNFRRDDISDYDAQQFENGLYEFFSLADFANGQVSGSNSIYQQNFASQKTAYLALYNIGVYGEDEWQANQRLKVTLGLRFDRTGNPACNNNCFASYNGSFPATGVTNDTPYNQSVTAGQRNSFASIESVVAQPRFGFNYDITGDGKTVVRGGVGLFADLPAATFLDSYIQNFPQLYAATVLSGHIAPANSPTSAPYYAAQSNALLGTGFTTGQNATQISNTLAGIGVPFSPPNLATAPHQWRSPKYVEWSMQIQRQLTNTDAVIIGYAGNEGYDEIIQNTALNASSPTGFGGLPTTSPDPRFNAVTKYQNEANSNYNGVSVTYKHIDRHGLSADVTYTYSHAMDDVSNGGVGEYYNIGSSTAQLSPFSVSALNYANSDYDIRHNLVADYVYEMPFRGHSKLMNSLVGGWLFSGKTFWRTGQPFSVFNTGLAASATNSTIGNNQILAEVVNPNIQRNCQWRGLDHPCFSSSDFASSSAQNTFGNVRRNYFTGPHYSDTDIALSKKFLNTERVNLQIGTYAFDVFNHPNFQLPAADIAAGSVGLSGSIAGPPTSPYGSFQGSAVSGRVLQVFGKVTF
ncbi:MAG: carboxypeptidase regulatory-like domain-containing protein [Acidobacteria bacterium]|nr:carboxypeptidase regulatory-like domain-containing protein [Acidobacteriota bacterium]